jgi:tRNA (adenine57-N1/adenine58-N1)-methyltransferase
VDIESIELLIRVMEAREGMTRPSMRMIGHTTYLVFARKVQRKAEAPIEDDESEEPEE